MLDPSDSKQRSTLVDLAWLLFSLYLLYSVFGFRNFGCQQVPPQARWDAVAAPDAAEPPGGATRSPFHETGRAWP